MEGNTNMTVEYVGTDTLVPYANNAKIHTEKQIAEIANSIDSFGFNDPIAVWTNEDGKPEIVEGHGRVLAAQMLGIKEVPIIHLDYLSDEERRAYTHVHNQTTLSSGFDLDTLEGELKALDFDWGGFGFDEIAKPKPTKGEIAGEVDFPVELEAENNYVVLKFDNSIDWLRAQTVLGVKPAIRRFSTRYDGMQSDKMKLVRIGHVLDGNAIVDRLVGGSDAV